VLYIFILRLFQATHVDDATSAYFEIYLESMAVGPYTKLNYRSGAVVGDDDRSVNDRALTVRARLMKDVSAGEMIGCRSADRSVQCTQFYHTRHSLLASRVTYGHTPVDTPSH